MADFRAAFGNDGEPAIDARMGAHLLHGRTAFIAGASRGIGAEIARSVARHGARVALFGRDTAALTALAKEIHDAHGQALAVQGDVQSMESVLAAVEQVREELGPVDLLVNSAGYGRRQVFLSEQREEDWQRTLDINLSGSFRLCRAVLPGMLEAGRGGIVLVSSVAGKRGLPANTAYCASKFGTNGLVEALACEVGPSGVRVNAVAPGITDTASLHEEERYGADFMDSLRRNHGPAALTWPRYVERAVRNTALRRLVDPAEVADLTVFLLSDLASAITGQVLSVDGGVL